MKYILRIGLGLLLATLLTNPLTGQYVNQAIDIVFTAMFSVGAYIALAFTIYTLVVGGWLYWQQSRVNIPKPKKTTPAFIET